MKLVGRANPNAGDEIRSETVEGQRSAVDEAIRVAVNRTVAGAFSASETLDVGRDLGSPVSFAYFDRSPFAFDGKIASVEVTLQ